MKPINDILREMYSPEGRERMRQTEQAFRRGYHQAWSNAIDDIFDMLESGMTPKDAYALCALHVNRLAAWRAEDEPGFLPPPAFQQEQLLETLHKPRETNG